MYANRTRLFFFPFSFLILKFKSMNIWEDFKNTPSLEIYKRGKISFDGNSIISLLLSNVWEKNKYLLLLLLLFTFPSSLPLYLIFWLMIWNLSRIRRILTKLYAEQIFTQPFCWIIDLLDHVFQSHVTANPMYLFTDSTIYTYSNLIPTIPFDRWIHRAPLYHPIFNRL